MQWRSMCSLAVLLTSLAAGSGLAAAERSIRDAPTFATMDRQDATSLVGGQLGFTFLDPGGLSDPGGNDLTGLRFDLYGQFVGRNRVGFYGIIPLSRLIVEDVDDESAVGNVEAGLLYILPTGPGTEVVLHGGVTLPTADSDIAGARGGVIANQLSTWPRLTDFAQTWPKTFWVRLALSPIVQRGRFVLRADLGVDAALASDDTFQEPDPIVRVNLGGGLDTGTLAVLGELVTIANTGGDTDRGEDLLHTFALSLRIRTGRLEPAFAVGFPLDDSVREFIDLFLIIGLQGRV